MNQNIQTVRILGREIRTTITDQPHVVDEWIKEIIGMNLARTIGLSCQRNPHSSPEGGVHNPNKVATLQMFAFDRCIIVQLFHMAQVPDSLKAFLGHPKISFAVVGEDAEKLLREQYGLEIATPINLEKTTLAYEEDDLCTDPHLGGFRQSALRLCEFLMLKPFHAPEVDWEARVLTVLQIQSACVDTYVAYMLCRKLTDEYVCRRCLFKLGILVGLLAI